MKKVAYCFLILGLLGFLFNCGDSSAPATPREASDLYVKKAQAGDVKGVENLSTESYQRRAKKEVGRFQRYSKCTFVKEDTEDGGEWQVFYYNCDLKGGGNEEVMVAVKEENGKYVIGDVD